MEKDEEGKWLRSEDIDSVDREKGEDLMSLTFLNKKSAQTASKSAMFVQIDQYHAG